MIPHSDRRDRSLSGRAQDERQSVAPRDDHVVRELILRDCLKEQRGRTLRSPPGDEFLQRAEARQLMSERGVRFR